MRALPAVGILVSSLLLSSCSNDATSTVERGGHFELVQAPPTVGLPGYPLYDSVKVRLIDRDGSILTNTAVSWVAGTGTATGPDRTDAEGYAAVEWTLGPETGPQTLEVRTLQDSALVMSTEGAWFSATHITADYSGGCALRAGDIWCWGAAGGVTAAARRNVSRFLVGSVEPLDGRPSRATLGESFVDLRVTDAMICGLRASGQIGCAAGEWLGDTLATIQTLVAPALRSLTGGPASTRYMCGLAVSDSTPWCWNETRQAAQVPGTPALTDLGGLSNTNSQSFGGCGRTVNSTIWCWGGFATPVIGGQPIAASQVSVSETHGCALRPGNEAWCWEWAGSTAPTATKVADGILAISSDDGIVLGLLGGHLVRWDTGNDEAWSMAPVTTVAARLFSSLLPNLAYCTVPTDETVWCGGEHFTNASGYYNDQFWPLQPVNP